MAAHKKLPPVKQLRRLVEKHGSSRRVAEILGVDPQSIYNAFSQEKYKVPGNVGPGYEFMPWWVTAAHLNSSTARRLRIGDRLKTEGSTVPAILQADYRDWLQKLEDNDFVISYHPETVATKWSEKGGFFYRPRRNSDSPGIMQVPDETEQPPSEFMVNEWARMLD